MTRDRDIVDIPEVFRRAFDDEGWDQGGGDEDGNGGGGPSQGPSRTFWTNRWIWIAVLIVVLLLSFNWIVSTYTELLWFDAQSFRNVWLTQLGVRLVSFLVFFVVAAVILLVNWRIAFNNALKTVSMAPFRPLELPGIKWAITGIGLFAAFIFASAASARCFLCLAMRAFDRLILWGVRKLPPARFRCFSVSAIICQLRRR